MRQCGYSILETTFVLGLLGLLCGLGVATLKLGGACSGFLGWEARGVLDQALLLARARGSDVRVALGEPRGDVRPLGLPRGFRWGLPSGAIPRPPDMKPTAKAHLTGAAHAVLTVTPRGTATAGVWFLTDGRDALCVRLSGRGAIHVLRWRRGPRAWTVL